MDNSTMCAFALFHNDMNPNCLKVGDVIETFDQIGLEQGNDSLNRKLELIFDLLDKCQKAQESQIESNGLEIKYIIRAL